MINPKQVGVYMRYIIVSVGIMTMMICGCATVESDVGESDIITTTNTLVVTGSKLTLDDVPKQLEQPIIPEDKVLTLSDVVNLALNNNKDTQAAWQYLKMSEEQRSQAGSYYYPTIDVNANVTKQYTDANIDVADSELLRYGPGASLAWLIFDFGGRSAGVGYADRLLDAQLANYNQSIQDVLLDSSSGYFELNSAIEVLASLEIDITNAVTTLESAQKRMDAKLGTELDVLNAKSKLEQVLYEKATAESSVQSNHAGLAYVLGLPANIQFDVAPSDKPIDSITNLTVKVDELIEQAMNDRSDLQALEAQKLASEEQYKVISSDLYPTFSLGGDASYSWYDVDTGVSYGLEDEISYSAFVKLDWNVFDGFLNTSKRREALYQMENAETELEQGRLTVSADVWNKYYDMETAVKQFVASSAYLSSSSRAYDLASKSYKNGLISILDLLDSQSDVSLARRQEIQSRNNLFVSFANLAHATGKLSKDNNLSTDNNKENK
jgi:outer membrane protein